MGKFDTALTFLLLGGVGYVAYKFYKGDWKLPTFGVNPQSFNEGGVPAVAGDMIYNITYPTELRESATTPTGAYYKRAKDEITDILPINETPTDKQIVPRAVSMAVSEDIHEGGFLKAMLLSPITIGAGLGAITQQQRYYSTLPEGAKHTAIAQEYTTRSKWMFEHPIESFIGLPAQYIHIATRPEGVNAPTPVEAGLKALWDITPIGAVTNLITGNNKPKTSTAKASATIPAPVKQESTPDSTKRISSGTVTLPEWKWKEKLGV